MMFTGVNCTFFPMHFLGLQGMPRRYSQYPEVFAKWHGVSSVGAVASYIRLMYFLFILWERIISQRGVICLRRLCTSMEWMWHGNVVPKPYHHMKQVPLIFVPKKKGDVPWRYRDLKVPKSWAFPELEVA